MTIWFHLDHVATILNITPPLCLNAVLQDGNDHRSKRQNSTEMLRTIVIEFVLSGGAELIAAASVTLAGIAVVERSVEEADMTIYQGDVQETKD
jgi:hypothetical protein